MNLESLVKQINCIARDAGQVIMQVYKEPDFDITIKKDDSPVTKADVAAHEVIQQALLQLTPDTPILSEEDADIPFEERQTWEQYWLIDPLDGTKEFIQRNGEFTVNIALIEHQKPVLGVIYIPVDKITYYAAKNLGAFKQDTSGKTERLYVRSIPVIDGQKHYDIVTSRRHGLKGIERACRHMPGYAMNYYGSSLKMCMIAEGKADFCPRFAPTSEWDTAAAQILVEEAGGQLVKVNFEALAYNQKESLLNPHFLVLGDSKEDWSSLLALDTQS